MHRCFHPIILMPKPARLEKPMIKSLKTPLRALGTLITISLLAACASGPPKPVIDFKQDYDFGRVNTIAFYKNSGQVVGENPLRLSDMQHNRVDRALEQALTNKGMSISENAGSADLLLSWHLVTEDKTKVRTYETPVMGVGYGPYNRYSMYRCWACNPTRTEVSVQNYTQGTFIVDLIDPRLKQSVWRSVVQSRLKAEPETDQEKYNAAAAAIFASFPPP